jgi:hypothetical protein
MLDVVMLSITIVAPDGTNVQYLKRLHDIQLNDNQLNVTECITHQFLYTLLINNIIFIMFAEYYYAECRYAECHYAQYCGT